MSQFVEEDRAATTFRINREVFTSREILELERQLIFDKTWIFVGHASEIPAPNSGSMALNGRTVAEQIGAQIFIDGWAMVSPGNPEQAARLWEWSERQAALTLGD